MAKTKATRERVMANSKALAEALDAWLAEADEETVDAALRTFSKEHGTAESNRFSPRNACLIRMQDEGATLLYSNLDWLDRGRRPVFRDDQDIRITVAQYLGDGKNQAQREADQAAEAAKQPGEISSKDLEAKKSFYTLTTLYDVAHTAAIVCRDCGEGIHRTGFLPGNKRLHTWTHTTVKNAGHEALPPKREKQEKEVAAV